MSEISDRFRTSVRDDSFVNDRYNDEYYAIIVKIEQQLKEIKPNTWRSIEPYINKITRKLREGEQGLPDLCGDPLRRRRDDHPMPEATFDLLCGLVQSSKSIAICSVLWIMNVHFHVNTIFLTKKLSTIREDIIGKFKKGFLPDMIDHVIDTYIAEGNPPLSVAERKLFHLKAVDYTDKPKPGVGIIPVYLMQGDNLKHLVAFYNAYKTKNTMFMIDEIHEMYSAQSAFVDKSGVSRAPSTVKQRTLIEAMYEWSRRQCLILGITATPQRAIACNPKFPPQSIIEFMPDQPFPGSVYHGFSRDTLKMKHIEINEMDNVIDTIDYIIDNRTATTVPCILINVTKYRGLKLNAAQLKLCKDIQERFGTRVYCKTLLQQKISDPVNLKKPQVKNFFDPSNLTNEICRSGAFIMVAKQCVAAGVSIRSPLGERPCEKVIDGVTYKCNMLTDQIMHISKESSVESVTQLLRIMGWYPEGHATTLWIPADTKKYFETDLCRIYYHFIDKYNPEEGVFSVDTVPFTSKYGTRVCGGAKNDCYTVHQPFKIDFEIKTRASIPTESKRVDVDLIKLRDIDGLDEELLETSPSDYESGLSPEANRARRRIRAALQIAHPTMNTEVNIGWNIERYNRLLRDTVDYRRQQYSRVKCILVGPQGNATKFKDSVVISFRQAWEDRMKFISDTDDSLLYYQYDDTNVVFLQQRKLVKHKFLDSFRDWEYSDDHKLAISDDIDVFAHIKLDGKGSGSYYSLLQKVFGKHGLKIYSQLKTYHQQIKDNAVWLLEIKEIHRTNASDVDKMIRMTIIWLRSHFPVLCRRATR